MKDDSLKDMAVDSSGNIYVTGMTNYEFQQNNFPNERSLQEANIWLTKFASNGSLLWQKKWTIIINNYYSSVKIATDATDSIYLIGDTAGVLTGLNGGKVDSWLIKFDSKGSIVWQQQWGTSEDDSVADIKINNLSEIYVLGITDNPNNNYKSYISVRKYHKNGALLWEKNCKSLPYSAQIYLFDETLNLEIDDSSDFYITGTILIPMKDKPYLLNSNGNWILKYSDNK